MFNHLRIIKYILAGALAGAAIILTATLILGGLFFDIDASAVASWFFGVIIIIFALLLIYALIAFICWFLGTSPYVILILIGALVLVFLGIIILWLINKPAIDLGAYLQPIFSFLK